MDQRPAPIDEPLQLEQQQGNATAPVENNATTPASPPAPPPSQEQPGQDEEGDDEDEQPPPEEAKRSYDAILSRYYRVLEAKINVSCTRDL